MNWDQIEVKWAAMARRVRSDLPDTMNVGQKEGPAVTRPVDLPEPPTPKAKEVNVG